MIHLMDRAFDFQLVRPAVAAKALKRKVIPHFPDELVNRCPEMEIML